MNVKLKNIRNPGFAFRNFHERLKLKIDKNIMADLS